MNCQVSKFYLIKVPPNWPKRGGQLGHQLTEFSKVSGGLQVVRVPVRSRKTMFLELNVELATRWTHRPGVGCVSKL